MRSAHDRHSRSEQSSPQSELGEDWTLRERLLVAWDRGSVRWLVGLLLGVVVVVGLLVLRSKPVESVTRPEVVRSGTPVASSPAGGTPGPSPGSGAPSSVTSPGSSASGAAPNPTAPIGVVIVHVMGPVRRPGVVTLPIGSRVADAVAVAGGATKRRIRINLARVLVDGEQIDVGAKSGDSGSGQASALAGGSQSSSSAVGSKINLNQATPAELEELPRVGPVLASKIIEFRTQHGGFRSVDQLQEVPGIGDATFAQISPHVVVS